MNDPATETQPTGERHLTFRLGDGRYAIPLALVKEVIEMTEPTPVPQTAAFVRGVINLRGRVITVYDLRLKLKLPNVAPGAKTAIVIVNLARVTVGVVVDRVSGVVALRSADLSPAPVDAGARDHLLTSVARQGDDLTLILDLNTALELPAQENTK